MDDVKEALIKVANGAGKGRRSAPYRRCASSGEKISEETTKASEPNRRQTVIGLPSFFGGGGGEAKAGLDDNKIRCASTDDTVSRHISDGSENTRPAQRQHIHFLATEDSNRPAHRKTVSGYLPSFNEKVKRHVGRHTVIGGTSLFPSSEIAQESNIWNEGLKSTSQEHGDLREAIWINRRDGNVDIEKECRKLYSEEQDDKKGSVYRRRASLLLERPRLSLKGNHNDD